MYNLLAICLVLHPQCVDESIQQVLREKQYNEKMYKMQCGDLAVSKCRSKMYGPIEGSITKFNFQEFESCFVLACPKFLSPTPPPPDAPREDIYVKEAIKHQTKVFMDEVCQQKMLPTIRSYLKLYTTLPLSKLATFMSQPNRPNENAVDLDKEIKALCIHLLCFKHKMKNVVWTKGTSGLDGKFQSGSEVKTFYETFFFFNLQVITIDWFEFQLDFYIDHDMIHIADTKVAHRYGDFFIRKILKFEELNRKLQVVKI